MNWQRLILGLLGLSLVVAGMFTYLTRPDSAPESITDGILIRVGLLFCVTWLAMPQLETVKSKIPGYLLLVVLIALIMIAVRPKIFPIIAGVLAAAMALSWVLKFVSNLTSNPPRE